MQPTLFAVDTNFLLDLALQSSGVAVVIVCKPVEIVSMFSGR